MIRRTIAPLAAAWLVALVAPPVYADGGVLVVPLSGELGAPLADAPEHLTDTLMAAAKDAGIDAIRAEVSRAELNAVTGCTGDDASCLLQIAETLGASEVLVGTVSAGQGDTSARIELTVASAGGTQVSHSIALRGASTDELAAKLRPIAVALFKGEPLPVDEPNDEPNDEPRARPDVAPNGSPSKDSDIASGPAPAAGPASPGDDRGRFDLGQVKGYSWGIAGGGIALATIGAVFLGIAEGKQADVDDAPTNTAADLDALAELEDEGKRFNRWGNGMLVVGGAAAIVGAVLIIKQARTSPSANAVSIAPVPLEGGAGVLFTWALQ